MCEGEHVWCEMPTENSPSRQWGGKSTTSTPVEPNEVDLHDIRSTSAKAESDGQGEVNEGKNESTAKS